MRVAIVGNGIIANLAALYFKKKLQEKAELILIGPDKTCGIPVVGESTSPSRTNNPHSRIQFVLATNFWQLRNQAVGFPNRKWVFFCSLAGDVSGSSMKAPTSSGGGLPSGWSNRSNFVANVGLCPRDCAIRNEPFAGPGRNVRRP